MSEYKIGVDRPIPFIFCGKNFGFLHNGATVSVGTETTTADLMPGESLETMFNPNRSSGTFFYNIGSRSKNRYYYINIDLTDCSFDSLEEEKINVICLDSDFYLGLRGFRLRSYTNSAHTLGEVYHVEQNVVLWADGTYKYGAEPRLNTHQGLASYQSLFGEEGDYGFFDGFDGKHVVIVLDEPIEFDHPYLLLELIAPSFGSIFGADSNFKEGLWDSSYQDFTRTIRLNNTNENWNISDQAITADDPYPGGYANHIILTSSGKTRHQTTEWIRVPLDYAQDYIFRFFHKQAGYQVSARYPFEIECVINPEIYDDAVGPPILYKEIDQRYIYFDMGDVDNNNLYCLENRRSGESGDGFIWNRQTGERTVIDSGTNYLCCQVDESAGFLFFIRGAIVQKINLSTGSRSTVLSLVGTNGFGIALDRVAQKIYYTQPTLGVVKSVNYDGSGAATVITTGVVEPYGITLDQSNGLLYFIDNDSGTSPAIKRCTTAGGSLTTITSISANCRCIQLDGNKNYLWYTNPDNDGIYRSTLTGSTNLQWNYDVNEVVDICPRLFSTPHFSSGGNSIIQSSAESLPLNKDLVVHGQNSVYSLWRGTGAEAFSVWDTEELYLNILSNNERRFGCNTDSNDIFTPNWDLIGRLGNVYIRFKLYNDLSFSNGPFTWKIDYPFIRSMENRFYPSFYINKDIDLSTLPQYDKRVYFSDQDSDSGFAIVNRIGLFHYKFAMSAVKNLPAHPSDLGGKAGIIVSLQEVTEGTSVGVNVHGQVAATFTPSSGVKRQFSVQTIGGWEWKLYLEDAVANGKFITMIDPKGDFTECIISPNSVRSQATDPQGNTTQELLQAPPLSTPIKIDTAIDYLYLIDFVLKEV